MKKYICLFFVLALAACASDTSVKPVYDSKYNNVYEATCNGNSYTMTECYRLANQKCDRRFKVLNQSENVATYVDDYGLFLNREREVTRTLLFKCL